MPATSAEEVVVDLLARTDKLERSLAQAGRSVDQRLAGMEQRGASFARTFGGFLAGFSAGTAVVELAKLSDTSKQLDAQLRLATATFGTFGQAQVDVARIAETTRGSLTATASLYGNFVRATQQLGGTQDEAARATETFAKALKVGGADANAAASATLQFGQALASGVLRGDEFNSIAEASPRILKLVADAMGVTQGAVRGLAQEGKLTSDVLFRALTDRKFTAGIDAEFKQIPATFGDAMQAIENAAISTFGEFDKGGQFSNAIVSLLSTGTDTFGGLTSKAEQFGIDTRAVFDGLAYLFDPLGANGSAVLDALGIKIFSVREQIGSLLDSYDRVANFDANIENRVKAGFNRAIDRAGGGKHFELTPLSNLGGNFREGADRSQARAQERAFTAKLNARFGGVEGLSRFVGDPTRYSIFGQSTVRPTPTPAPPAKGGRKARAATTGSNQAERDAAKAEKDLANLIADIRAAVADNSGFDKLGRPESDRRADSAAAVRRVFGREGEDYDDPFAGVKDYDRERDARLEAYADAEQRAQDIREANVRSLADTFETLFRGGTTAVWADFKSQGLRALALILAQSAIQSFGSGGNGGGSFFKNLSAGLQSAFGSSFGGARAAGGQVSAGRTYLVGERGPELLKMQGAGTVIPNDRLTPLALAGLNPSAGANIRALPSSPTINKVFNITVRADNSVTPAGFAEGLARDILREAGRMDQQSATATRRALPAVQARYDSLGTT